MLGAAGRATAGSFRRRGVRRRSRTPSASARDGTPRPMVSVFAVPFVARRVLRVVVITASSGSARLGPHCSSKGRAAGDEERASSANPAAAATPPAAEPDVGTAPAPGPRVRFERRTPASGRARDGLVRATRHGLHVPAAALYLDARAAPGTVFTS